jgi:hypothetical protein
MIKLQLTSPKYDLYGLIEIAQLVLEVFQCSFTTLLLFPLGEGVAPYLNNLESPLQG